MHGESIIARSISATRIEDRYGNRWQYHSRSDRHSKIACWAILFDLLQTCPLLRQHVEQDKVAFGVNHEMRDFKQNKTKYLDLVLAGRRDETGTTFSDFRFEMGCSAGRSRVADFGFVAGPEKSHRGERVYGLGG